MIDFHTHVVPRSLEKLAARGKTLPHLLVEMADKGRFCCGYAGPRKIDSRAWDPGRRIADMDDRGVTRQVISPMPMTYGYTLDAGMCRDFWRTQNDGIADMVRHDPSRFSGLGGLPLQDCDLAIDELERVVTGLGLLGVEVGTRIVTVDLDDSRFMPFWQRCEDLGAVVFIHPESSDRVSGRLEPTVGYPVESAIVGAKLLASGLFRRHPKLRVVLSHGGGALPWLLPRMDQAWHRFADMQDEWERSPSELARQFYYDTLTFNAQNLRLLIERVGDDRILLGSDYPFTLSEDPPGAILRAMEDLHESQRARMLHHNAADMIASLRPCLRESPNFET